MRFDTRHLDTGSRNTGTWDVAVIGGGIVGVATARSLVLEHHRRVVVLEAESKLARHQSGRNSGVVHAGLYYRPGSAKAKLCVEGRARLTRFCEDQEIPLRNCGKLVVATREAEVPALEELADRAEQNGLGGLRRLGADEIGDFEPHASGVAGLWVPQTAVVEFGTVTRKMAAEIEDHGGRIELDARVTGIRNDSSGLQIETTQGDFQAKTLVNCAGLQSDRVARLAGLEPGIRIVPFRGEYYTLKAERRDLVRGLIYPVPDPSLPFLGVHFTRSVDDEVEAGPNAVLALSREGYSRRDISVGDTLETITYPGFWRLARRFWRTGAGEIYRSASRGAFVRSLRRLVPAIEAGDLEIGGAGVRAQAVDRSGRLLDDFHIVRGQRSIHVLNAPSPAATASLAIGSHIAKLLVTA